jgi:AmmeMemoRadiSam system protein B
LDKCAVSQCTRYETPLGGIEIDTATTAELYHSKEFDLLPLATDNAEHSLEMHLPYLYKVFSRHFATPADHPRLVPILVGNTDAAAEQRYGRLLAPYLADPTSIFVISSDFCHWGARFGYTYYLPTAETLLDAGIQLRSNTQLVAKTEIHQSIGRLDDDIMHAIAGGMHTTYLHQLGLTGNTVCGRHPIGIALCALGELRRDFRLNGSLSNFHFLKYARSSEPSSVHDSSVSYASAVAVVKCSDVLADLEIMDDESDEMAEDAGTLVTLAS